MLGSLDKIEFVEQFSDLVIRALEHRSRRITWRGLGFEINNGEFQILITSQTKVADEEIEYRYQSRPIKLYGERHELISDFVYTVNDAMARHMGNVFEVPYDHYGPYIDDLKTFFDTNWQI